MERSAQLVEAAMMSPEAVALAQAWRDGAEGRKPLAPEVMALFDLPAPPGCCRLPTELTNMLNAKSRA